MMRRGVDVLLFVRDIPTLPRIPGCTRLAHPWRARQGNRTTCGTPHPPRDIHSILTLPPCDPCQPDIPLIDGASAHHAFAITTPNPSLEPSQRIGSDTTVDSGHSQGMTFPILLFSHPTHDFRGRPGNHHSTVSNLTSSDSWTSPATADTQHVWRSLLHHDRDALVTAVLVPNDSQTFPETSSRDCMESACHDTRDKQRTDQVE